MVGIGFLVPWDVVLIGTLTGITLVAALFAGVWVMAQALLQEWRERLLKSIAAGSYKVFAVERIVKDNKPYWHIFATPEGKDIWRARHYELPAAVVTIRDLPLEKLGLVKKRLVAVKRGRLTEVVLTPANS